VETTDHDFKRELETKKAKNWLKSVSAFSNGNGGTLYFGVVNPQEVIEKINEIINQWRN
jgi:ATP-dependent DNA helicase RecG